MSSLKLSLPLGIAAVLIVAFLALLPFTLSSVESVMSARDAGGLAAMVDRGHVQAFARTRSPSLVTILLRSEKSDRDPLPLREDQYYEWVSLRTASGQTWMTAVTDSKGTVQSILTPVGIVPPPSAPLASLRSYPYFRSAVKENDTDVLWVQPRVLSSSSSLLSALLSPADAISLTLGPDGRSGTVTSYGVRTASLPSHALPIAGHSRESIILQGTFALTPWVMESATEFATIDQAQAAGLRGVLQSLLQRVAGSTDLPLLIKDIGQKPFFLSIARQGTGYEVFLSGQMTSAPRIQAWKDMIQSAHTVGRVRTTDLKGEQQHIDIVEDGVVSEAQDWTIISLSDDTQIALKGSTFVIAPPSLIETAITSSDSPPSSTMDLTWLQEALPLPAEAVETFLGSDSALVEWERDTKNPSSYHWRLK
ncbi:MAG: hypothetical protein ABL890_01945 [Candidatus Peribacteraceae bacterium]